MSDIKTAPEITSTELKVFLSAQELQCILDALHSHAKQLEDIANEYRGDSFMRARMNGEASRAKALIGVIHGAWNNPD